MTRHFDPVLDQNATAIRVKSRRRDEQLYAAGLALAGACFLLYPVIRPFSDEASLAGARAFASASWLVAHSLAIAAFLLLAIGILGLYSRLEGTRAEARGRWALVLTWVGVGMTLPYYGAEVFGLHAVGATALTRSEPDLLTTLTTGIRWGLGIWFIVAGLILLALGGILAASAIWTHLDSVNRWSGIPLAVGIALYIPQFTGSQPVRIAHGVLMAAGCCWLAWTISRMSDGRQDLAGRSEVGAAGGELA